jgi:hypothetical protein
VDAVARQSVVATSESSVATVSMPGEEGFIFIGIVLALAFALVVFR